MQVGYLQSKIKREENNRGLCYEASFFCGQLEPSPTGELWDTVWTLPRSYPKRDTRKLGYLSTSPSSTVAISRGIHSPELSACPAHSWKACFHAPLHAPLKNLSGRRLGGAHSRGPQCVEVNVEGMCWRISTPAIGFQAANVYPIGCGSFPSAGVRYHSFS